MTEARTTIPVDGSHHDAGPGPLDASLNRVHGRGRSSSAAGHLLTLLVVGGAYALGAELAWRWFGASSAAMVFYPPAGITVAALVLLRRRLWPAALVGAALAEGLVDLLHGIPVAATLGYVAANITEVTVGVSLLLRNTSRASACRLDTRVGMQRFVVWAAVVGPAVGGLIGGATKSLELGSSLLVNWVTWWAGDAMGVIAVGAFIIVWATAPRPPRRTLMELGAVCAFTAAASAVVFWQLETAPSIVILPMMIWTALRLGVLGVATIAPVVAITANAATAAGVGVFATGQLDSPAGQLGLTQLFLAVVILVAWYVAFSLRERVQLEVALATQRVEGTRLRLAAEAADLLVYEMPLESGAAATLNLAAVMGLDDADAMDSQAWQSRIHPEDLERYVRELDQDVSAQRGRVTGYRMLHADGHRIDVEDHRVIQVGDDGVPTAVLGAVRDVTSDRYRLEVADRLAVLADHTEQGPLPARPGGGARQVRDRGSGRRRGSRLPPRRRPTRPCRRGRRHRGRLWSRGLPWTRRGGHRARSLGGHERQPVRRVRQVRQTGGR